MSILSVEPKGDFRKVNNKLERLLRAAKLSKLDVYGKRGVERLKDATPRDTGKTAESWDYKIEDYENGFKLVWYNTNVNKGQSIAVLIQNGHATRSGTWVPGIDYINPALEPIIQEINNEIRKELKS